MERLGCIRYAPLAQLNGLSTLSTETASELDVLWLDGDTLCVDSSQVCVFKEGDEVSL